MVIKPDQSPMMVTPTTKIMGKTGVSLFFFHFIATNYQKFQVLNLMTTTAKTNTKGQQWG